MHKGSQLVTVSILNDTLNEAFASFFGQFVDYLDRRLDERLAPIEARLDAMQNALDSYLVRLDSDEIERAAMNMQLDRHGRWINQLADKTDTKLQAA